MLSAECAWRRRFIVLDGRKKDVASNGAASSAPLVSPSRPGWITKRQLLGMSTAPPRVSAFSRISSSRATLDTPTSRTTSSTRERVSCPLFFHLSSVLFRFISFFCFLYRRVSKYSSPPAFCPRFADAGFVSPDLFPVYCETLIEGPLRRLLRALARRANS